MSYAEGAEVMNEIADAVTEAMASTERRHAVEQMIAANDATLKRLHDVHKVGIPPGDISNVRLAVLIEYLIGDMDQVERLDYEEMCADRFKELLAGVEQQVSRSKLLKGVDMRIDPNAGPPRNGRRRG